MNKAHNLKIEELIKVLNNMKSKGHSHVHAIVYSDFDLAFRPAEYKKEENIEKLSIDRNTDFLKLI